MQTWFKRILGLHLYKLESLTCYMATIVDFKIERCGTNSDQRGGTNMQTSCSLQEPSGVK